MLSLRTAIALIGTALVGGVIATLLFANNPANDRTSQDAPEIWFKIESRLLSDELILRGETQESVSAPVGSPTEGVVTAVNEAVLGVPLIEVSGSPVFLLHGDFPSYRDLHPGLTGPDVSQLNEALNRLGYSTDGDEYDSSTAAAVEALYRNAGYEPLIHVEPDLVDLRVQRAEEQLTSEALNIDHDTSASERDVLAAASLENPDESTKAAHDLALRDHDQIHRTINAAAQRLATLDSKIEKLAALGGVAMPVTGGVFVPVDDGHSTTVNVGDRISQGDPLLQVNASGTVVAIHASQGQLEGLRLPVAAVIEVAGQRIDTNLHDIDSNGTIMVSIGNVDVTIGEPVRATVITRSSDGPVLAIPVTALTQSGDTWTVVVRRPTGIEVVIVEIGAPIGGWVEIIGDNLVARDEVRVG